MDKPVVAVVAFDGISLFHLSVPCLVFGEDRTAIGFPSIEFRLCAARPRRPLRAIGGADFIAPHGLQGLRGANVVIVPSWRGADVPVPDELTRAIADAHADGALVVGLCLGTFVLAAAGVLNGRRATTHWASTSRLAADYPEIVVEPDVLYVNSGAVVTSAGVAASLDCCIYLVRRLFGASVAQRLARQIVLPPHRQGGQAQFIEHTVLEVPRDEWLSKATEHVLANLSLPHSLDSIAGVCGLTRRTFTRRFQKAAGTSFSKWLIGHRVSLAQRLLETSRISVEEVARLSGFGTPVSLRQHFRAALRTTPDTYRREFSDGSSPS